MGKYKLFINKKAAMFGLDARIALAIFGALSIISGAVIYNIIKSIKITKLITEMQEIGKAWEQYMLDTSQDLSPAVNNYSLRNMAELIEDPGVPGWSGPYLNYKITGPDLDRLAHPEFVDIVLTSIDNSAWGEGSNIWGNTARCTPTSINCFNWISVLGVDDRKLVDALDKRIDKGDGAYKGNFRWYYFNDAYKYRINLKYAPYPNP